MRIPFVKHVSWYLIIAMFLLGIAPRVDAGLSPSEVLGLAELERSADLLKIQKVIETKMIWKRLEEFGFTQEEICKRLSQLDGQQIHQLALKLDELRVGGDSSGLLIFLLLTAIAVLLYFQYTGKRIVVQSR